MSTSLNILIFPHQRLRHVQPEVNKLDDSVMRLYGLDVSVLRWAECREGVLARFEGAVCPEMLVRIPSAKLDCTALLLCLREGGGWGCQLCFKGSVEDSFQLMPGAPPDSAAPEQHAARLVRRFRGDREKLLFWLTQEVPETEGFQTELLEGLLGHLAPWAWEILASGQLAAAPAPPVPDSSSPEENAPDRERGQHPSEREPSPEACLPFLTGVRALRRGWPFPLSLLYRLFPQKRPALETAAHEGWTVRELEDTLERFYAGDLAQLELEFSLSGAGTYIRRLKKTVYHPFRLTLVLIREKRRCMCLLLDDQQPTLYRLVANRDTYMNVDIKDLKRTVFHGQSVEEYTVFSAPLPPFFRQEISLLLARLDRRDSALSATARMGVWSCEGLHFNREQYQQFLDAWLLS